MLTLKMPGSSILITRKMEDICLGLGIKVRIYRTQMTQSNADVVYYQQVCVTLRRLHPVFPLITPVLQEAPCAPRYEEGV